MAKILVVGSINLDLVIRSPHIPGPGETVLGTDFGTFPGGKGANQAVAAARQGADVTFLGRVGKDEFGKQLLDGLKAEGIAVQHVGIDKEAPSGVAFITLDAHGENCIVVAPGANYKLSREIIRQAEIAFTHTDLLLVQLEIPLDTVMAAVGKAKEQGMRVVLNPAPAQMLPDGLFSRVDVLIPNESECAMLSGHPVGSLNEIQAAAAVLIDKGVGSVVVTLGDRGAYLLERDLPGIHIPAYRVEVVDTTSAGDAFLGAFSVSLSEGNSLVESVKRGCAAGALAATRLGAQPSIPTREEVEQLFHD